MMNFATDNLVHFALVDAAPLPGMPKVRYFTVPNEAKYANVMNAVHARMRRPMRLTFLETHQVPTDARWEAIPGNEVGL